MVYPLCVPPQRVLRRLLLAGTLMACAAGCTQQQGRDIATQLGNGRPQELFQTSVDRMATLSMQDNLQSLYLLMSKLYLRNPNQWRESGFLDAASAERQIRQAIEQRQALPQLGERRDLAALSYALSPEFRGDRVGAFIYAIGSMLVTAHGGRTEFFITDTIDPQFVSNAARNIEKATWLLSQRQDANGVLLLFSNEISEAGSNLSFAVEFGKIVARLDLLTQMLDERYRRIGLNYAQSLLLMNFLPVQ
ncbi:MULTISPECIES: hypothetical protein [Pseudomonas]|jgi:hypothetical protein|uniref:Lipoprotein n=2 Tax=Pseudomonas TaxID=286 RepID=A0A9X8EFS0_PSEPU|nr:MULTISPECIES: hypothetical protein [Pseudomonas]KIU52397.1 lipoprotein [Pseudomonas putida]MBG8558987.1 hypothetical protein [Pseudomonas qingdaonensis]MCO7504336.1 hypothetical protein [Pseudomonas sp. VE 267-6A]MCO7529546.1 hypothetical protein [Pseudomonas sp. 2]MCP8347672.1 hypothetical protein [Pseudomonas sp. FBF18]